MVQTKKLSARIRALFSRNTQPPASTLDPSGLRSAQARLAVAHSEAIVPTDVTAPPVVTISPSATAAYEQTGRDDAEHPGTDEHTGPGHPEQPSAAAVRNSSRTPLDRLGERWEQIKALYETGRLGLVAPREIRLSSAMFKRTWHLWLILLIVVGAGLTAELVYGIRAAALLTVADPATTLLGAIAFSLAMNGLAWYAAHMLFTSNQNVVRRNGTRFALAAAMVIGVLIIILGLVVGGFDPLHLNTVEGGGAAVAQSTGPDSRWTLAGAYMLILAIVSASIAAGHLLILEKNADLEVLLIKDAERRAHLASLKPIQQTALVISLGEAIAEATATAHHAGCHYVAAYNASFRHHAPVVIAEMFGDVKYDDQDPTWLPGLRAYLDVLRSHQSEGEGATITRIA